MALTARSSETAKCAQRLCDCAAHAENSVRGAEGAKQQKQQQHSFQAMTEGEREREAAAGVE